MTTANSDRGTAATEILDQCRQFLEAVKQGPAVKRMREIQALPTPPRTVVVIGEVKRGKSSLVNALTGTTWAPVGVDITTSAYIRFEPPFGGVEPGTVQLEFLDDPAAPAASRTVDGDRYLLPRRWLTIPLAELSDWVSVNGAHVQDPEANKPLGAVVAIDPANAPGIALVDTPGVNGLDPAHAETTLRATKGKSVLLMVCDANAPISGPELEFLAGVTTDASAVVLAVTMIDQARTTFAQIIDENRALLAKFAPRFAGIEIIGVSSVYAQQAATMPDPARRATAMERSGIPQLSARLTDLLDDPRRSLTIRTAQAADQGLEAAKGQWAVRRATLEQAPAVGADMTREAARLDELRSRQRDWAPLLSSKLQTLQIETDNDIRLRLDQLRATWNQQIDRMGLQTLSKSGQALVAQMTGDIEAVARAVTDDFREGLQAIAVPLLGEAQIRSELIDDAFRGVDYSLRSHAEFVPGKGLIDPMTLSTAMSGGPLLALGSAIGFAIPGGPLVAGALWAAVVVGFKATKGGKEGLHRWLNEAVRTAREDLQNHVRTIMVRVPHELRATYSRRLEDNMAEAKKLLDQAREAQASEDARRTELGKLNRSIAKAEELQDRLRPHLRW